MANGKARVLEKHVYKGTTVKAICVQNVGLKREWSCKSHLCSTKGWPETENGLCRAKSQLFGMGAVVFGENLLLCRRQTRDRVRGTPETPISHLLSRTSKTRVVLNAFHPTELSEGLQGCRPVGAAPRANQGKPRDGKLHENAKPKIGKLRGFRGSLLLKFQDSIYQDANNKWTGALDFCLCASHPIS